MILKLEDQVVSLETSKKLKELGFRQESLWYWVFAEYSNGWEWTPNCHKYDDTWTMSVHDVDALKSGEHYSAYTASELGELLPRAKIISTIQLDDRGTSVGIRFMDATYRTFNDHNEAEARALMLIYLAENKLMEVKS